MTSAYARLDPFVGQSGVCALAAELDWSETPLGPVSSWPAVLRSTIRTCLDSPIPIALWCGPDLQLIYNDAYVQVLGSKHPEALGRSGGEVWEELWPKIRPLFEQIRVGGPPVFAEDEPFVVQRAAEHEAPDQPNAWFTFALSPVRDEGGEVIAFLNIVSETTARVQAERAQEAARIAAERAEARLREVFEHAPAFLAVMRGSEHVFEYVNEAYYRLVGRRELIGHSVLEGLPELRGQGFRELLDQVFESGEPYIGKEVSVMVKRGGDGPPEERFVDFVYYPLTDPSNTRVGVVAHGSDVTDHVLARREAHEARSEAEQANQAKSQFLANISHEIRTPINAIIGYTDLLELGIAGPVTEEQQKQLGRVRSSSQHLLMLIDDVLDLAKIEAGRTEFEQNRILTAETVTAALALVEPQADHRGLRVTNLCSERAATHYVGDEDRVRQILVNLLSNAIKFTETGGEITIDCGSTDRSTEPLEAAEDGPLTFIRISDTGIGIAPGELENVFQPFAQVERGHTRQHGGTGLGLTISRQFAWMMGGDLTVSSEPGEGSTFTLWLPSRPGHEKSLDRTVLEQIETDRPQHLLTAGRVLQEQSAELLQRFMQRVRQDPEIPMAAGVSALQLEDHSAALVADIAQALVAVDSGSTGPERLLQDSGAIQHTVADLHGGQRAQLGWTPAALTREWAILRDEIECVLREHAAPADDLEGALRVVQHFLEFAERISQRSLRRARVSGIPGT